MCTLRRADGVTLAYRLWRPGPPRRLIVFVHGLASNHTRWTEFVRATRLRETWDLLRLDLRGFGRSLSRGHAGPGIWCEDLAAIMGAEGATRAVVVRHCLGANVALHFAARDPASVAGLVLIEPMFREALTGPYAWAGALRAPTAALASLVRGLNSLGLYRRHLESLDLEQLDREARASMAGPDGFPEKRYGSPLPDLKSTPTSVYLAGLLALTASPPSLRGIRAPALARLSRGGRYGDPEVTRRRLTALSHCETRMLEARHWIPTESPAEMRQPSRRGASSSLLEVYVLQRADHGTGRSSAPRPRPPTRDAPQPGGGMLPPRAPGRRWLARGILERDPEEARPSDQAPARPDPLEMRIDRWA